MATVEALIRKHDNFEKTMSAQSNKIDGLEAFATELVAAKHYNSPLIQSKCQAVCNRRDKLKESALVRRKKQQESRELQKFLRNIYEVRNFNVLHILLTRITLYRKKFLFLKPSFVYILGCRLDQRKDSSCLRRVLQGPYKFVE